jgi:NCS1 family nucleobase:cation symporter-1
VVGYDRAGGFGPMLSTPSQFAPGSRKPAVLALLRPALTGMVGFWATLSLNIPTSPATPNRSATRCRADARPAGRRWALYSFIGVAVTSATIVIFGHAMWDPVEVLTRMESKVALVVAIAGDLHRGRWRRTSPPTSSAPPTTSRT